MLIFISGSINAGKTTTSKLLAERLGWSYINIDDLTDKVDGFNIYTHLDLAMDLAIKAVNKVTDTGQDVIANFVIRKEDYKRFEHEIHAQPRIFITLSPGLKVAQSQRGDRVLTEWEIKRIKAHHDDGIATPEYGYIVDNSNLTVEETVDEIIEIVENHQVNDPKLKRFLNEEGQVLVWPKKQVDKERVIAYLVSKFEFNKSYHEREVNEILKQWHVFSDWPLLRRELFERGYLDRNRSGTDYRRLK